jgi:hypothetical protein
MSGGPRAPAMMTIRRATFHPWDWMILKRGWYLLVLNSIAAGENLSLQKVNLMKWMISVGSGWLEG